MNGYQMAIGCDPGYASGAIAFIIHRNNRIIDVQSIRLSKSTFTDRYQFLSNAISEFETIGGQRTDVFGLIEKVSAMPGQGVSSTFKFGYGAGRMEGLLGCLNISYDFVTPQKWQKGKGIFPSKNNLSKTERKNLIKGYAQRMFPQENIVLENADSYVIASHAKSSQYRIEK